MELREYPLLNTPTQTLAILRTAEAGDATIEDFARALESLLAEAHEHPPVPPSEIRDSLARLAQDLAEARLLARKGTQFTLTDRGQAALLAHPEGFARAEMMEYSEFAAFVRERNGPAVGDDPRGTAYDQGFSAGLAGETLEANPHQPDAIDHLAWESGWSEAREETTGGDPSPR